MRPSRKAMRLSTTSIHSHELSNQRYDSTEGI
jgi:hypothetical protein